MSAANAAILLVHPSPKFWAYQELPDGCHIWYGGLAIDSGLTHQIKDKGYGAKTAANKLSQGRSSGPYARAGSIEAAEWLTALGQIQWLVGKKGTFPAKIKPETAAVLESAMTNAKLTQLQEIADRIAQMLKGQKVVASPKPQRTPEEVGLVLSDPNAKNRPNFDFVA